MALPLIFPSALSSLRTPYPDPEALKNLSYGVNCQIKFTVVTPA